MLLSALACFRLAWKSFAPRLGCKGQPTLATDHEKIKLRIK